MSFRAALAAWSLFTTLALPALGDVPPGPPPNPGPSPVPAPPPPPDLCNVERAESPDRQCRECAASAERPDKCQRDLESGGYRRTCRSEGGSSWTEVWCRDRTPSSPTAPTPNPGPPPPDRRAGCGACRVGSGADGDAIGLALLALGVAASLSRRRRAH